MGNKENSGLQIEQDFDYQTTIDDKKYGRVSIYNLKKSSKKKAEYLNIS